MGLCLALHKANLVLKVLQLPTCTLEGIILRRRDPHNARDLEVCALLRPGDPPARKTMSIAYLRSIIGMLLIWINDAKPKPGKCIVVIWRRVSDV